MSFLLSIRLHLCIDYDFSTLKEDAWARTSIPKVSIQKREEIKRTFGKTAQQINALTKMGLKIEREKPVVPETFDPEKW